MRSEYSVTYGSGRTKEFANFDREEDSRRIQIEKGDHSCEFAAQLRAFIVPTFHEQKHSIAFIADARVEEFAWVIGQESR